MSYRYDVPFADLEDIEPFCNMWLMSSDVIIGRAETAMLKRGYLDYRFVRINYRDEYVEFLVG